MYYGPFSYFSLGRVAPRERLREPYLRAPGARFRFAIFAPLPVIFRRTPEGFRIGSRPVQE